MKQTKFFNLVVSALVMASMIFGGFTQASASAPAQGAPAPQTGVEGQDTQPPTPPDQIDRITPAERQAAADLNTSRGLLPGVAGLTSSTGQGNQPRSAAAPADPSVTPHYFGPYANYANSPLPKGPIGSLTIDDGGTGYVVGDPINIYDVYGTGMGATAQVATVGVNGAITGVTITDPGADYSAPIVVADSGDGNAAFTPVLDPNALSGGLRKFVDTLPGLGPTGANNLGNYISVGVPDTTTYGTAFNASFAADYYEIALVEFTQQLHSDLPPTTIRGYVQLETPVIKAKLLLSDPLYVGVPLTYLDGSPIYYPGTTDQVIATDEPRYLGATLVATQGTPIRIKFYNFLPTGAGGDLFIPVDETVMGAGEGPLTTGGADCNRDVADCEKYTQNRATLHLHGGLVPWISDGTPHQWVTPAGENTQYPKGVSVAYVPDMPNPGDGALTFYYNNQQSARLQFYHDHAYGITRLNVYAGEAAGYVVTDVVEQDLINGTNDSGVNPGHWQVLPGIGVPLILQDKTFVDATTIDAQDPTWKWGTGLVDPSTGRRTPNTGDMWLPSVYMPIQNPWDPAAGANAFGRWQYGPWFWPPTENILHGPIANEYYDPACNPALTWCEPPMRPDMPTPSMGMEAYMDTSMVNGAVYPYVEIQPQAYRFRILNAANDRFYNLQMYVAVDANGNACDVNTNPTPAAESTGVACTEVRMVDALANPNFPTWPADAREGGVPDPTLSGPEWIQIGTEGGFLPSPVTIPNQPISWQRNPGFFNAGNVLDHSLLLGNAERADVIVDFSAYAGKTIILYNDAPTAFPALDPRYDYYTGNPSQMDSGGAPTTQAGYGPNTRTVMQIRVANTTPTPYNLNNLNYVFSHDDGLNKPSVFEASQPDIIVPQAAYASAYGNSYTSPTDATQYAKITDRAMTFTPMGSTTPVTVNFEEKAIHDEMGASYDIEFGRMSGNLGLELPGTNNLNQNIILYGYASPPVDFFSYAPGISQLATLPDGTTLWKITHNGVDTHPIHIHLANAQLVNRVGWDGLIIPPDANELGWKETIRINPLESTIWAVRPELPVQPFDIVNSERPIDPTYPIGTDLMGPPGGFIDPALNAVNVPNHVVNYGWEYVWHCHILSHEEMDMMHSLVYAITPDAPSGLTASGIAGTVDLSWTDNSVNETDFTVQRSQDGTTWTDIVVPSATGPAKGGTINYADTTATPGELYIYRVLATNIVGDRMVYPAAVGFPTVTRSSAASNTVANQLGVMSILRADANPTNAASVDFDVTFSQAVTVDMVGPDFTDFALTSSTVTSPFITAITGSGSAYTVTVNTGTNSGILDLDMVNASLGGPFTTGEVYTVEKAAPTVVSVVRTAGFANPTNLSGVNFTVTFDKAVTGVDVADFATSGTMPAASVLSVAGSGTTYTVTALTGVGNGTLGLNVLNNGSVVNSTGTPLDAGFTGTEFYTVDTVPPTVVSSTRVDANPTVLSSVRFTVTFSEAVTGVDTLDFGLYPTVTGASITSVTGTGTTRTVTVSTGTGAGSLRLNVQDNNSIKDAVNNSLGGTGTQSYSAGQSYTVRTGNFQKLSPANLATGVILNPTLSWNTSNTATSYEYCIDTTPGTTCDSVAGWVSVGTSLSVPLTNLTSNTTYYWQVRANLFSSAVTYANNAWWSFTTMGNVVPGAFAKSAPVTATVGAPTTQVLSWAAATSTDQYEYCIDTTPGTTCDSVAGWVSTGLNRTVAPAGLVRGTKYYWQVRAVNVYGTTEANAGTWWTFSTVPGTFQKLNPTNGKTNVSLNTAISWNASTGATSYEYCIDTTAGSTCDSVAGWVSTGTTRTVNLVGLNPNTTYYWQVRSVFDGGYTYANNAWWSFRTAP